MKHCLRFMLFLASVLPSLSCAVPATGTPVLEPITIKGTYEYHSDIRGGDAGVGVSDKIDLVVLFTATADSSNTMKGVAQVTYTQAYDFQYTNEDGLEVCHHVWATDPIIWTPILTGTYQRNPDGSLSVVLLADPKDGPSYTQFFQCDVEESKVPSFAFVSGLLVDGKYIERNQYVLHPMVVGSRFELTTMEVVP